MFSPEDWAAKALKEILEIADSREKLLCRPRCWDRSRKIIERGTMLILK